MTQYGTVILAIDPGSREMGAALFKNGKLLETSSFHLGRGDRLQRSYHGMEMLHGWFQSILVGSVNYRWTDLVYESPAYFTPREPGQARPIQALERMVGMLEYWALIRGMRVFGYNVATVKTGVIGRANATKEEVEVVMRNEYNLHGQSHPSHIWDALAVGTYHLSQLRVEAASHGVSGRVP